MARKSAAQDCLRFLVDTLQKAPPASGNVPRKDVPARQPPAAFSHRSRGLSSDLLRCLEKVQLQTAFGFGSIPCEKSHQPSELCSEKTFRPGRLQLWGDPLRKASPAFGDLPRKNVHAGLPSAAFPHRPRGSPGGPLR